MKIKVLSMILVFMLVFVTVGFCCDKGAKDGTSESNSSSDRSSSSGDTGRGGSSSDSDSSTSSGRFDEGDRNGLPKDCDPFGITGLLCPEESTVEGN